MTKGIYKFCWPSNRGYGVEAVFTADSKDVTDILGKEVYFEEICGKHSEVYGTIDEGEITLASDNPEFVKIFEELDLASGHNPFDYYEPYDVEENEDDA